VRWTLAAVVGVAGAYVVQRARRVAEQEGRPLTDVLPELPHRLAEDVATIPRDLRMAAHEGKLAADRRVHELDEYLRRAGDAPPPSPEPDEPSAPEAPPEPEPPQPV
jgi:hypothetical protein